jgi:hypothetical protein
VYVPVNGDEDLRFDLGEPVDDVAGTELGKAGGSDGAHARTCEKGHHSLRDGREASGYTIPTANTNVLYARARPTASRNSAAVRLLGPRVSE